jgi:hypothetical protein
MGDATGKIGNISLNTVGDPHLGLLFPATLDWVKARRDDAAYQEFMEYLYGVDNHWGWAHHHAQHALTMASTLIKRWQATSDLRIVTIANNFRDSELSDLLHAGDSAVRHAVSAVEAGLFLTGHALRVATPPDRVVWHTPPRSGYLRADLKRMYGAAVEPLESAIDSLLGKENRWKGLSLLYGYRDWTTHRGAPFGKYPQLMEPIPVDLGVYSESFALSDPFSGSSLLTFCRERAIDQTIEIWCWPILSGVRLSDPQFADYGDLRMPGPAYDQVFAQPDPRQRRSQRFAGQDLDVYSPMDFAQTISNLVWLVKTGMGTTSAWDEALKSLISVPAS